MLRKSLLAGLVLAAMSSLTGAQDVPRNLWPPTGSTPAGSFAGQGVQVYVCSVVGSAMQWTWRAPAATLVDQRGMVFAEYSFGPTFAARDSSRIVGTVIATAPAPRPGAIGWYAATVTSSSGRGLLVGVRTVQQLNTIGGLLSGPCAPLGAERRVPYSADYLFWR